jgi:hypothetical protein
MPAHCGTSIGQPLELVPFDPTAQLSGRANAGGNLADSAGHSRNPGHFEFLEAAGVIGARVADYA